MRVRDETPDDAAAIGVLTQAAFANAAHASGTEATIVQALRSRGQLSISLVAEVDRQLLGHVAVSPVALSDGSAGWYGLGPISVMPAQQGKGIGSALMQAAIARLEQLQAAGCVVLGDPGYYQRFGFRNFPQLRLPGVPAEYFMALPLAGDVPQAEVRYDTAFEVSTAP